MPLTFQDLYTRVGDFLGVSDTPTATELARCQRIVNDGYRLFLMAYNWSFRVVTMNDTFAQGSNDYVLPGNFGSFVGEITYDAPGFGPRLRTTSDARVRNLLACQPTQGRPSLASIRVNNNQVGPEGYQLRLWPMPDRDYPITYCYRAMFADLTEDWDVPLGANQHSETILEACLMIAERRCDDTVGIHTAAYKEQLALSIATDKLLAPDTLGENHDGSDDVGRVAIAPNHGVSTYNGETVD